MHRPEPHLSFQRSNSTSLKKNKKKQHMFPEIITDVPNIGSETELLLDSL